MRLAGRSRKSKFSMTSSPRNAYEAWRKQTEACAQKGVIDFFYDLAGITLCIKLHQMALARPFLSAISHLAISPTEPDYVIDVWDCKGSGGTFPRFDCGIDDVKLRGEIPPYCGGGIQFAYFAHARMVHVLSEIDRHGIVGLMDANELPKFELACPFRGLFSWILRNHGMSMIHCAAVADDEDNAYMIMGKSGAGKSTTAISCLLSGMNYLGDDLCAIGIRDNCVQIYSIYSSGKTFRTEWSYLPTLAELSIPIKDRFFDKEIYFFAENFTNIARSGRLKTIFVPSKVNQSTISILPPVASLISITVDSTRELLPDARFESLPLLYAAFKQANISLLPLSNDRHCPIALQ